MAGRVGGKVKRAESSVWVGTSEEENPAVSRGYISGYDGAFLMLPVLEAKEMVEL